MVHYNLPHLQLHTLVWCPVGVGPLAECPSAICIKICHLVIHNIIVLGTMVMDSVFGFGTLFWYLHGFTNDSHIKHILHRMPVFLLQMPHHVASITQLMTHHQNLHDLSWRSLFCRSSYCTKIQLVCLRTAANLLKRWLIDCGSRPTSILTQYDETLPLPGSQPLMVLHSCERATQRPVLMITSGTVSFFVKCWIIVCGCLIN